MHSNVWIKQIGQVNAICLGNKPHASSIRIKAPRQSFFLQFHICRLIGIHHLPAQITGGIFVRDISNHIPMMSDSHNLHSLSNFKAIDFAADDKLLQLHNIPSRNTRIHLKFHMADIPSVFCQVKF